MNWLRTVLGAFVAMLIVIGIAVPLTTHLAPLTGRQVFAVRGASMEPAIPMGAMIVVADHGTDDLAAGDVITWRGDNGVWVTHRIVQVVDEGGERMFQTQGDANEKPDGFVVPARAVIGSVEFWIPLAGFALIILATPAGIICWLSFALGLLLADSLLGGKANGSWPRLASPSSQRAAASRDAAERSAMAAAVLARVHRTLRDSPAEPPAAAGWPIHFEGVTVFGDDRLLLDEMTRCADGDHRRCITDVRPRACLIQTQAASAGAPAADPELHPEPVAARALAVALPSVPEVATRDEDVAWVSREVSRAAA